MFEDASTEEKQSEDDAKSNWWVGPWAHVLGGLGFGILIIPLHSYSWGWQVSIAGGYSVLAFCRAFGSAFENADDLLGNPRAVRSVAMLLIPHAAVVLLVVLGVSWWFHIRPELPTWVTHEGRKGSLWYWFGMLPLALAGYAQGAWMAGWIKRQVKAPDD